MTIPLREGNGCLAGCRRCKLEGNVKLKSGRCQAIFQIRSDPAIRIRIAPRANTGTCISRAIAWTPLCLLLFFTGGWAQSNSRQASLPLVPLPVTMEFSQAIDPWGKDKLATDHFKLQADIGMGSLRFSNQSPGFLGGKKFLNLPGGYRLLDLSFPLRWGAAHVFRSQGFSSRGAAPERERTFAGGLVEIPSFMLGTQLTGFLLRSAPRSSSRFTKADSPARSEGSQIGLVLARAFRKSAKLRMEWTQSRPIQRFRSSGETGPYPGGARHGLWTQFDGTLARTELTLRYITREESLVNPVMPAYSPAEQTLSLDIKRRAGQHQLQFGTRSDHQRALPMLNRMSGNVREEMFRWSYAPRRLPQLSVSRSLRRQDAAGKRQQEESLRLSTGKSTRRVNASFSVVHGRRCDVGTDRILWVRNVLAADAVWKMWENRSLHVRFEKSGLVQHSVSQRVSTSGLQFDTRGSLWEGRVSLAPALNLRRQAGSTPALSLSIFRFQIAAAIKLPRCAPGTELLLNFASIHSFAAGDPPKTRNAWTMRWIFKSF